MTCFSDNHLCSRTTVPEYTAKDLFKYLHDVIYNPPNAVLDIEKLPENLKDFGRGLKYFAECVMETMAMAQALSKGDLASCFSSRSNEISAPLKSLHASLKHLTWQAEQIAFGDYSQRVEFMGDFSNAFNLMVEQLAERQKKLECKINQIQIKTASLEQSNLLVTSLIQYVPQQIIVMDRDTHEILLINDIAKHEVNNDAEYIENLLQIINSRGSSDNENKSEITYTQGVLERYFTVETYYPEWNNSNAVIYVVSDVSAAKGKIRELEIHAYRDSATKLFNRTFGMLTLDNWVLEKKCFTLIFVDLDSLKYINDEFGHYEGDVYIKNAAKHLKTFSVNAVVCRIGGDEFMLLAPNINYDEAHTTMTKIYRNFSSDDYLKNKTYSYSISFGIVTVNKDNNLSSSEILSIADKRMYESKRMRKKERQK